MNRAPPLAEALRTAAEVIAGVLSGRTADSALATAAPAGTLRAAAMELAYPTLRSFGRGDFLLGCLVERPLRAGTTRGLLLAALERLEARPDQAHTIVDQAVEAAAALNRGRHKALVNGVLRTFQRRREELLAQADADDVARWRHPPWWIRRVRRDYPDRWEGVLTAGNSRPPMTLRVNCRRISGTDYVARLAAEGIAASSLGDSAVHLEKPVPVERLPGFAEGLCSVQDFAAQAAAGLLDVTAGMRVLDACAAPGGKAAHLLERADLSLLALDADANRARRIEDNLRRLGLAADVRVADARALDTWWDGRPFDRILADVPCSASGVVRRHPDAKWLRRESDIAGFAATQAAIVDALWRTLVPGGKMLYATCSVFAEENARQVEAFVGRHADARLLTPVAARTLELPDAEHDGLYYALLEKA